MKTVREKALVVGASRGIGREIALRLASDGFDIVGTCRKDASRLDPLAEEIRRLGVDFSALAFDISDRAETEKVLLDHFGSDAPDVLVYNAGIREDNLFVFMTPDEWDHVMRTNADGFFNCVRPLIMNMMAKKNGRIIAISSVSGQTGQAGQVNYSASKAALIGAVKALARETGRKNIRVNAVAPGFIETEMTSELPMDRILPMIPLGRSGRAEEVAGAVSFLAGKDSTYIQGQVIAVNGGLFI